MWAARFLMLAFPFLAAGLAAYLWLEDEQAGWLVPLWLGIGAFFWLLFLSLPPDFADQVTALHREMANYR